MRCHACDQPATRQWQRAADPQESADHLAALRRGLDSAAEGRRLQLQLQIASLENATRQWQRAADPQESADHLAALRRASLENAVVLVPPTLSATDRRALTGRARTQIAKLQAEHDAVAAPADLDHHLPVTVAVFGCEDHAPDAERAALLHEPGCDPAAETCCGVTP